MKKSMNLELIEKFVEYEKIFSTFLFSTYQSVFKFIDLMMNQLINYEHFERIFLFLINEENYLFEFYSEYPLSSHQQNIDILDILDNTEILNTSIRTLEIQIWKEQNKNTFNFLVPLLTINKLIGFVIIKTIFTQEEITLLLLKLLKLFFNQFSTTIDLLNTKEQLNKAKDNYQQLLATQSLETQRTNLEFSERLKEITSNLSMILPHEIRTPINQILGSTKLLKEYMSIIPAEDAESMREIIDDIDISVNRLRKLSENYLFYSNLVIISNDIAKLQQISQEKVLSPQSIIFERAKLIMQNARRDNLVINLIDAPIKMNEVFLNKIIEELLDNAIKFSFHNSPIKVNTHIEQQFYVLTVFNYGKGLSKEEINAIQPFLQFDRDIDEQQGSGLGLSIVYKIPRIFGGKVEIQSTKESNFEISVYFPLAYN